MNDKKKKTEIHTKKTPENTKMNMTTERHKHTKQKKKKKNEKIKSVGIKVLTVLWQKYDKNWRQ